MARIYENPIDIKDLRNRKKISTWDATCPR